MSQVFYHQTKRVMDVFIASVLILIFLPFWILVPILVKLESQGAVILKHKRVGKDGELFYMYKFRSMVHDAHDYLHRRNPELLKKFKDGDWKLENDPRITKVGKILRSLTIDEFPQLINVLTGEMSMVGPRAYMRQEIDEQVKKHPQVKPLMDIVLTLKPGITGPWQVSGRNEIPFVKRAKLDVQYAKKANIFEDIRIILKTPKAMLSKW